VKLARYLAIHDLTQGQFAAAVGVSRVCINHWVNERKIPLAPDDRDLPGNRRRRVGG